MQALLCSGKKGNGHLYLQRQPPFTYNLSIVNLFLLCKCLHPVSIRRLGKGILLTFFTFLNLRHLVAIRPPLFMTSWYFKKTLQRLTGVQNWVKLWWVTAVFFNNKIIECVVLILTFHIMTVVLVSKVLYRIVRIVFSFAIIKFSVQRTLHLNLFFDVDIDVYS